MIPDTKILLADDEETFLHATADLLRDQGYLCDCATNADDARLLLEHKEYDLLISDINMPGNGQLEFLHSIHGTSIEIPVIVVTGYPSVQTAVHSFRLAAVDYLQKPIIFEELIELIEPAVQKGRFLRKVRETKKEINALMGTLESLETTRGRGSSSGRGFVPVSEYFEAVISHLASVSLGLKTTLDSIKNGGDEIQPEIPFKGMCSRCQEYREMLYRTIQVLTKTKEAFKSKMLAELRRQVESTLQDRETGIKKTQGFSDETDREKQHVR